MTDRQRAILQAAIDDPDTRACGGCSDGAVTDWRVAQRGTFVTHGSGARRCRMPCVPNTAGEVCEHLDCIELRVRLNFDLEPTERVDVSYHTADFCDMLSTLGAIGRGEQTAPPQARSVRSRLDEALSLDPPTQ